MEFANKLKYERAKAESDISGESIHLIYVRMGGLLKENGRNLRAEIISGESYFGRVITPIVSVENPEVVIEDKPKRKYTKKK